MGGAESKPNWRDPTIALAIVGVLLAALTWVTSDSFRKDTATTDEVVIRGVADSESALVEIAAVSGRSVPERILRGRLIRLDLTMAYGSGAVAEFEPARPGKQPNLSFRSTHCPGSRGRYEQFTLFLYGEHLGPDNFGATGNASVVLSGLFDVDDIRERLDDRGRPFCFVDLHEI